MSNGKHRVSTPDESYRWIAQHGGEIDEKWKHQDELNTEIKLVLGQLMAKVDILLRRIAWATGVAAGLGGVITVVYQSVGG